MDSKNSMLETIESFGPQLFDLDGSLSLWMDIIGTSKPNSVNKLLEMIEDMDSLQKYNLAKRILKVGFDCEDNGSDEETEIEDIVYETDDQLSKVDQLSECSTKSYETALDFIGSRSDYMLDEETNDSDSKTTRSLVDIEDDLSDPISYYSEECSESSKSDNGLSGQILSLSTITSIGSGRSRNRSKSSASSDSSDNSFYGFE